MVKNKGHLLVLDVDGVMIDPAGSFEMCVAMALKEMLPELAWSKELYWELKRIPGFNNDFRLMAAAVALFEAGEIDRLGEGINTGFPHLEKCMDELEPRCKERMQFYYQDLKHLERPLITLPELEAIVDWDVAILTGRPPDELPLAFEILGFEIPAICDSCPEFRKPEPGGLIHLADRYRANRIYFVGDTRDDATCLRRAREVRPDLNLTFVAVNKLRYEISKPGDLTYITLREFISSGTLGRCLL
ncbi:MAG: HAD-IA family hydrolase [Holophagales bacterium]|jgi:HAD superfamily hydrolase (TIGR01549 family)|nr:HAD-IA family hydrolase [Holophagales bacterium]